MENIKKCSFQDHREIDAIYYFQECKIYMCNKCENIHSKLIQNHKSFLIEKLEKGFIETFSDFCKIEEHNCKLEFFCKTHNELCCAACLCKIKKGEIGKHKDCHVCLIEDIKEEKINKLKENIKYLEELSNKFDEIFNKLKLFFEKINENKEELKLKIQNTFTKIRNELNNREDDLLKKVDTQYEELYFNEKIIKEGEKLPNKIKLSLEKGKIIEKEYNEFNKNNLILLMNNCINVENNIKSINIIQENTEKFNNLNNYDINFSPEEEGINNLLNTIKNFGNIYNKKLFSLINDSIIITKEEEKILINSWISQNKNIKYELLYRATRDGDKVEDFHRKCDNNSPILVIGKTPKGYIFGGYTKVSTNFQKNEYTEDGEAFVFSLNQKKKYYSTLKNAIYKSYGYCIIFGGGSNSLQIENNILTNNKHWSNPNGSYGNNLNLTENKYFSINELEVFHVKYI